MDSIQALTTLSALNEEVQKLNISFKNLLKENPPDALLVPFLLLGRICSQQNDILSHLLERSSPSLSLPEDAPTNAYTAVRESCMKAKSDIVASILSSKKLESTDSGTSLSTPTPPPSTNNGSTSSVEKSPKESDGSVTPESIP